MNKVLKLEILSCETYSRLFPLCSQIDLLSIVLKSILINGTCIKEGFNRTLIPRTHFEHEQKRKKLWLSPIRTLWPPALRTGWEINSSKFKSHFCHRLAKWLVTRVLLLSFINYKVSLVYRYLMLEIPIVLIWIQRRHMEFKKLWRRQTSKSLLT